MFKYSSEDCELIIAIKETENLSEASFILKRDISVISRKISKLHNESNLIEKINGRWLLTENGNKLYLWAKKAISEQSYIEEQKKILRIGTTREFASRILIPNLGLIGLENYSIEILTSDGESEKMLLEKKVDIAIDCGIPYHPDIRFKKIAKERMVLVCSSKFYKTNKVIRDSDYLHYHRNNILDLQEELGHKLTPQYTFNDLSAIKAAVHAGLGYTYIPYYVVQDEINSKKFHDFKIQFKSPMSFGIWWQKDYNDLDVKNSFLKFLSSISLE